MPTSFSYFYILISLYSFFILDLSKKENNIISYIVVTAITSNVIRYDCCYNLVTHVTVTVTMSYDT